MGWPWVSAAISAAIRVCRHAGHARAAEVKSHRCNAHHTAAALAVVDGADDAPVAAFLQRGRQVLPGARLA